MGWPKGKPRGPRKKVAAKREELVVTFGNQSAPAQETAKPAPDAKRYYRNARKTNVFCSAGKVEFGQVVELSQEEAGASPWWESCQKPD